MLYGVVIMVEGGLIIFGEYVIVMENVLICVIVVNVVYIGVYMFVGMFVSIVGVMVGEEVFFVLGVCVFNGVLVGNWCEVWVNVIVYCCVVFFEGMVVLIGWVVVGDFV